ncbi:MAG: hypothetical protein HDT46_06955 [Ruminococcaceae bacterium]|nr:hypothetical protein [Oscillospiraceae bacterium]
MKKILCSAFVFLILFLCIPTSKIYALDFDPYRFMLGFENAPEGTVYIDVLIKMDTDDENYVLFTVPPKRLLREYIENGNTQWEYENLNIDSDSEIAKFNSDGYISMSLHYRYVSELEILDNKNSLDNIYENVPSLLKLDGGEKVEELNKRYGDFKAAYVDENGKVLGITVVSRTKYNHKGGYGIFGNGDHLTFQIFGFSPLTKFMIIAVPLAVFALIIYLIVKAIYKVIIRSIYKSR